MFKYAVTSVDHRLKGNIWYTQIQDLMSFLLHNIKLYNKMKGGTLIAKKKNIEQEILICTLYIQTLSIYR